MPKFSCSLFALLAFSLSFPFTSASADFVGSSLFEQWERVDGYEGPATAVVGKDRGVIFIAGEQSYVLTPGETGPTVGELDTVVDDLVLPVEIQTPEGLIVLDLNNRAWKAFVLRWDTDAQTLQRSDKWMKAEENPAEILPLPLPPEPVGEMTQIAFNGFHHAGKLYLVTRFRTRSILYTLDLGNRFEAGSTDSYAWEEMESFPDIQVPFFGVQSDGGEESLFVFASVGDYYKYDPKRDAWENLARSGEPRPRMLMANALPLGVHHLVFFGGKAAERETLSNNIFSYHTVTDAWVRQGEIPSGLEQFSPVHLGDRFYLVGPEIYHSARETTGIFGALNYIVLIVYLLALVVMGIFFSRMMHTTDDFFKAGQRIPWWAAGLSIFGTQLSAITFMAIPAKVYGADWKPLIFNLMIVAIAPFIVFYFLPFYRRLNITTAYEYLEMRLNTASRLIGSSLFILLQFGRIGIVLLLPSLALALVTGLSVEECILLMGVLCTIYTVLGGMEAVVWTDVLQVLVLTAGALLSLVMIAFGVEGGWNEIMIRADAADKMDMIDLSFSLSEPTFWVFVLGGFGVNLISYGTDQAVIQRYLTTKDEKAAANSIWTSAILSVPASILFFAIGTALFGFYLAHPEAIDPALENQDALFPYFIVHELPAGIAGLVIAAVFAASMSSLDSSMNCVAAAYTTDFHRRFKKTVTERECLWVARVVTVVVGILGTLFALWMARNPGIKSLWDQLNFFIGLFGGGLCGLFLLAIFTTRANGPGAIVGLAANAVLQWTISMGNIEIHGWFMSVIGIATVFIVGYVASIFTRTAEKDIDGLTIYTLDRWAPDTGSPFEESDEEDREV